MNGLNIYKKLKFFYYKYILVIMTKITINDDNINDFINCNPLEITSLEIFILNNIEVILNNLHKFVNLKKLNLYNNEITKIKGLDNLVNLRELKLSENKITEIKGFDNLVNLQILHLYNNKITEIKGLDNLVNLQTLYLQNNQITEIKGLDNLVNLQYVSLHNNKITEIKGLDNLVNLQWLGLYCNEITEIKGLDNLVNLQELLLGKNKITELPLSLCNFRNNKKFTFYDNPIEYIPLPVQRWLDRIENRNNNIYNDGQNRNNNIYNDGQNIHNHNIQTSFRNSLSNLLKDKPTINLETVKNEIISNDIITEQTKREILNYCDDKIEHFTYLITYSDLLIYVWSRIRNKDEILKVLNQEITDGLCMCFTGRMTRLLNVLVGFYDDIELQISDSEQITNIIMNLKNNISDNKQLKDAVKKELLDRQYSEAIINEWLEYI